jgi:phage recombination protein Bet
MSVTVGKDAKGYAVKEMRDVVMPGIGLYRINAARTGEYVGCSEPEFGPTKTMTVPTETWGDGPNGRRVKTPGPDLVFEFPEWCKITVFRLVDGTPRAFPAKEYFLENYATAGNDSLVPNAMWKKRPFAQLAKCTEAQGLRKAFPEAVGSQPTADEMEGKDIIDSTATVVPQQPALPAQLPAYADAAFDKNLPVWRALIEAGTRTAADIIALAGTKGVLSLEQIAAIKGETPKAESAPPAAGVDQPEPTDDIPPPPEGGSEPNEYWDAVTGEPQA